MDEQTRTLTIGYYAVLREQRGLPEEVLESTAATPEELYGELKERHQFSLDRSQLKVVINDAFASWNTPLNPRDTVVFIPPVAGG